MNVQLALDKASARHNSNVVWDGGDMFEDQIMYRATINILGTETAALAASGTVGIATTGIATFSADQTTTLILSAGDYFTVGTTKYTVVSVTDATHMVVTPAPSTAVAGGSAYVPYQATSFADFPTFGMVAVRPIPEEFRMRFGGTGTLSASFKFQRVDALTGIATDITTAVASTAAAVWQGVAAVATVQAAYTSSVIVNSVRQEFPVDEFIRIICTAKTTVTAGRTMLAELGHRIKQGATNFGSLT